MVLRLIQGGRASDGLPGLLIEHAAHLARHAGGEEKARLADGDGEAAGRADRIVDELRIGRQHRLLAVVGRHDPAAPGHAHLVAGAVEIVTADLGKPDAAARCADVCQELAHAA